ncbi:site-specific integrase [Paracoccus pantotrophus]|uniref:tyrosine-type recombinase/integrase n=1 Tax=Paracoccus pantotrophus TaxID=82367 RepID=UPI000E0943F4|nr:site-specific integrase [Paracoccus pantotrophus]RDD93500.1 site-specific integrase [Paracoccus pantotrophus]WGR67586.1 site-specific integrase [Paracoccus pantotrophus]
MPKIAKELKPAAVQALKHAGGAGHTFHAVGGVQGLLLQITATGGRSWIMRVRIAGQRKHFGLGGYPEVSLAEARRRAADVRDAIKTGADPAEAWRIGAAARDLMAKGYAQGEAWAKARDQRQAVKDGEAEAQRMTFAKAVDEYLKEKLKEFKSETHRKQWKTTLHDHAVPHIGKMNVDAITVHDIERTLKPIWETTTETASRLRGRIENVLAWATVKKHRSGDNPARWKGNLDAIMPKPSKVAKKTNQPALQLSDAPAWWKTLQKREGMGAKALQFLTLCASRSGEVRGAAWSEFHGLDGDNPMWIIPADRMKAGKEHRVPLSPAAVALLDGLPRSPESPYVFFAARGGMLSNMTLSKVMRDMQETAEKLGQKGWLDRASNKPAVPHGLRSTFRDWAAEHTEYPRDMAEIALAHTVGSEVERAYRRGDMLEKRRAMMADWAAFLNG